MQQTMANIGNVTGHWKRWALVWVLAGLAISLVADLGLFGTLVGTAGLFPAFWGVRSLYRAVAARSIEQTMVGSLGGRTATVQLVGDARPIDDPVTAPLTDTECVAYQVEVREYRPSNAGGGE